MGTRGDHEHEQFDRDRWRSSIDGRTLYLTASDHDQTASDERSAGPETAESVACGLCQQSVLPVSDGGPLHCPICGFAV